MQTLLVINGESDWQDYFPDYQVEQKKIQTTEWLLKGNELYVLDEKGICKPDKILWRVGAIQPQAKHKTALRFIQLSGVPCVNDAQVLTRGFDRLSMLNVLKMCELPVISFHAATSTSQLKNLQLPFPFVVKVGNFHGGFGKVKVENEEKWQEVRDILFISNDYVTVEPFIDYVQDIRYLAVDDKVWAMQRKGKYWKANVQTTDFVAFEPEAEWIAYTQKLQYFLQADILAIDVLIDKNGQRYVVEYNDIPGFSGFPAVVRYAVSDCVRKK